MCEELLLARWLGTLQGMKGWPQSAAACIDTSLVSPRKPHSWSTALMVPSSMIDASNGNFVPCSHGQTARLKETMFFTLLPEVKHVVPNDLFETNLLAEILVHYGRS
jgi:hypothetical protein